MYYEGRGVEKDAVQARVWLERAVANGQPDAMMWVLLYVVVSPSAPAPPTLLTVHSCKQDLGEHVLCRGWHRAELGKGKEALGGCCGSG